MGEGASSDITGLIGQYAHGNEPSHHIAYLYTYAGEQWKTAEKVRFIMSDFYTDQPDGIIKCLHGISFLLWDSIR
jgi:putative alpha-1,2-mannosidase